MNNMEGGSSSASILGPQSRPTDIQQKPDIKKEEEDAAMEEMVVRGDESKKGTLDINKEQVMNEYYKDIDLMTMTDEINHLYKTVISYETDVKDENQLNVFLVLQGFFYLLKIVERVHTY